MAPLVVDPSDYTESPPIRGTLPSVPVGGQPRPGSHQPGQLVVCRRRLRHLQRRCFGPCGSGRLLGASHRLQRYGALPPRRQTRVGRSCRRCPQRLRMSRPPRGAGLSRSSARATERMWAAARSLASLLACAVAVHEQSSHAARTRWSAPEPASLIVTLCVPALSDRSTPVVFHESVMPSLPFARHQGSPPAAEMVVQSQRTSSKWMKRPGQRRLPSDHLSPLRS